MGAETAAARGATDPTSPGRRLSRFRGRMLSVGELVARAKNDPDPDYAAVYGTALGPDAASAAEMCRELVAAREPLLACWRYGVLQALDYYDSARRRGGVELASRVFAREPSPTGSDQVDAAFAALAEHLAVGDGWPVPAWVVRTPVASTPWMVVDVDRWRAAVEAETPPAFRAHGVYISAGALARA